MQLESIETSEDGHEVRWKLTIEDQAFDLFFRSSDVQLSSSADAVIPSGLLSCMRTGSVPSISYPCSPKLLENCEVAQDILLTWDRQLQRVPMTTVVRRADTPSRATGVGCFFSGGVDSYYTFLKHTDEISHLILIHGFDMALDNVDLRKKVSERIRNAAHELGKKVLEVETNLRVLLDVHTPWRMAHGAGLATVAHLCSNELGRVYVPASHTYARLFPCGSHPMLDPRWSSETLEIIHDGCESGRAAKVQRIVECPVVLRSLRVCYRNPGGKYNCGKCDKCIRTMINLRVAGALEACETFQEPLNLRKIRQLRVHNETGVTFIKDNLDALVKKGDPDDRALIRALRHVLRKPMWLNVALHKLQVKTVRSKWAYPLVRPLYHTYKKLR